MLPIEQLSKEICQKLEFVFFDIDDTITHEGKLLGESYAAMWKAAKAGLHMIPVTGRPTGWVDQIARMWPVDAVVGENGGLYFWMEGGKLRRQFIQSVEEREQNRLRLNRIQSEILKRVPRASISKDQPYREIDLAIDFSEDVSHLSEGEIEEIVQVFREEGANAKVSSIHVNGWFGSFDKLSTCHKMAKELWSIENESLKEKAIFCGDSPNDEPMFSWFRHSVGVANVRNFVDQIEFLPTYITSAVGGYGFAEFIDRLLSLR